MNHSLIDHIETFSAFCFGDAGKLMQSIRVNMTLFCNSRMLCTGWVALVLQLEQSWSLSEDRIYRGFSHVLVVPCNVHSFIIFVTHFCFPHVLLVSVSHIP